MRLTYAGVLQWLMRHGESCSIDDLTRLEQQIAQAKAVVNRNNEKYRRALDDIAQIAKSVGVGSVQDLMALAGATPTSTSTTRAVKVSPRKPYMDPYDPASGVHALMHLHPLPVWAKAAIAKGWTKDELHYKRIGAAWEARGLPALYDPLSRHAEQIALEQAAE